MPLFQFRRTHWRIGRFAICWTDAWTGKHGLEICWGRHLLIDRGFGRGWRIIFKRRAL